MVALSYDPQHLLTAIAFVLIGFVALIVAGALSWHDYIRRKRFVRQFSDKPFDWLRVLFGNIIICYDDPYATFDIDELDRNSAVYRTIKRHEQTILDAYVNQDRKRLRVIKRQMNREIKWFDRVCQLDVPDLVKAKVWSCL